MASAKPPRKRDFKSTVENAKALTTVLAMEAESVFGRRTARVLGVVALFVVVVALFWVFLHWYISPDDAKERQGLALVLAISLGGIAAIVGLYFTRQTLLTTRKLDEDRAREAALRACLEQLRELVTDDKWDNENQAGRTLRQLAQADVLSVPGTLDGPRKRILVRFMYESKLANKENPKNLDLSWADLGKADLNNSKLPNAALSGVRLGGANLSHADLSEANLSHADLFEANLSWADLREADLSSAKLDDADLRRADLKEANLRSARGWRAKLTLADFRKADLSGADLSGAYALSPEFSGANLAEANLSIATLTGANLRDANLSRADIAGANLNEAVLRKANLEGANLDRANLSGAFLLGVRLLTQEQLEAANGNEETQLPPHLKPPVHWSVESDEQADEV
jgi:uncharacterized protein YjbI with pentapeptide repeats